MPRNAGDRNKPKEITQVLGANVSNEDKFLAELIAAKSRWGNIAKELEEKNHNASKEREYEDAYRVLINRFTADLEVKEQPNTK